MQHEEVLDKLDVREAVLREDEREGTSDASSSESYSDDDKSVSSESDMVVVQSLDTRSPTTGSESKLALVTLLLAMGFMGFGATILDGDRERPFGISRDGTRE